VAAVVVAVEEEAAVHHTEDEALPMEDVVATVLRPTLREAGIEEAIVQEAPLAADQATHTRVTWVNCKEGGVMLRR